MISSGARSVEIIGRIYERKKSQTRASMKIKHPMNINMEFPAEIVSILEKEGVILLHINGKIYEVREKKD